MKNIEQLYYQISLCYVCIFSGSVCAVSQTKLSLQRQVMNGGAGGSHSATHLHQVVIDVKRGIKRRVRANTPPPFQRHCTPRIPIQYLLRHLKSNLGWQAQMASLIQVNYLLNLSE